MPSSICKTCSKCHKLWPDPVGHGYRVRCFHYWGATRAPESCEFYKKGEFHGRMVQG